MNANEKYNRIIELIEQMAQLPEYYAQDIADEVAKKSGLSTRDMSAVFSYLMSCSLNSYITRRKMMAAYSFLISGEKRNISNAIEIAGYSDQPSFSKAFKKEFGITPGDAFAQKDQDRITPPLTWEMLSGSMQEQTENILEGDSVPEKMTFGISDSQLRLVSKAMELEAFYGLSRLYSNFAFEIHKDSGIPIEDCFRYADALHQYHGDPQEYDIEECGTAENWFSEYILGWNMEKISRKVFIARGITLPVIEELVEGYDATEEELMKCDMKMINMFPGFDRQVKVAFSFYVRAYEYYIQFHDIVEDDEVFNKYLDLALFGVPFPEALEDVEIFIMEDEDEGNYAYEEDPYLGEDPFLEHDLYMDVEAWDGSRIDDDLYYDPENVTYNEYDDEEDGFNF